MINSRLLVVHNWFWHTSAAVTVLTL
jgi:hypothetical protein